MVSAEPGGLGRARWSARGPHSHVAPSPALAPSPTTNYERTLTPDWTRIRDPFNPLYRVLVQMQEEIQTLRHELRRAVTRLDGYDEARINQARRLVGLPPARVTRSGMATPPGGNPVSMLRAERRAWRGARRRDKSAWRGSGVGRVAAGRWMAVGSRTQGSGAGARES